MPVLDNGAQYLVSVLAQLAILPICDCEFKDKRVVTAAQPLCNSSTATLS
jgi:hypothetical protein